MQLSILNLIQRSVDSGDTTGGAVNTISYLTVHLLNVILTGINRVVIVKTERVVTQMNIVIVTAVLTTSYSKTGMTLMVHKSGGMTGSVVVTTPYLTVHRLSVILTGNTRVAVYCLDVVVTQQIIVIVLIA